MRTLIQLPPGGAAEVVFFLGEAASADEARSLIEKCRSADLDSIEAEVARRWKETLGAVVVKTPEHSTLAAERHDQC